jgi:hypothetical protein
MSMDTVNIVELLDDLRGILVRSIEAQEHGEHEVATRLLAEARDKIDQRKKLLESSAGAGGSS